MREVLKRQAYFIGTAYDQIASEYYKALIYFLTLLSFCFYTYFSIKNSVTWDGWSTGDWLINYSAGFVRRGVLGEIIIKISEYLPLKINHLVSTLQIIFFIIFCTSFIKILVSKKVKFWFFFWATYPAFLTFFIFDHAAVGRKEIILFAIFSCWLVYLKSKFENSVRIRVILGTMSIFLTLCHELFFFFSGYFVYATYLKDHKDFGTIKVSLIIPLMSFLTLCLIFLFGGDVNQPEICNRLLDLGADHNICRGILSWKETKVTHTLINFLSGFSWKTGVGFLLVPLVIILPATLLYLNESREKMQHFLKPACILIALSIPLFFVAIDWGRWVNIHTTLLILCAAYQLKEKGDFIKENTVNIRSKFILFLYLICGGVVLLSSSTWMVRHCCTYAFFELRFSVF